MEIQPDTLIMIFLIAGALATIYGLFKNKALWIFCGMLVFILGVVMLFMYMMKS